jgi:hypothetical protein
MMEDDETLIELNDKTDTMATRAICPVCGNKYLTGVPQVKVKCRKCNNTHNTDFKQDIYTKKARKIIESISYYNKVTFRVDEKYEGAAAHIRHHFIEQRCYNVSEIKPRKKSVRYCRACGTCNNCMECCDCGEVFDKSEDKCPSCKSKNIKRYYFKDAVEVKKHRHACPECNGTDVSMTRIINKTVCHLCGSRKLSNEHIDICFEFTIERKPGYKR